MTDRNPGETRLVALNPRTETSRTIAFPSLAQRDIGGLAIADNFDTYAITGAHDATAGALLRLDAASSSILSSVRTTLRRPVGLAVGENGKLVAWESGDGLYELGLDGSSRRLVQSKLPVKSIAGAAGEVRVVTSDAVYTYSSGALSRLVSLQRPIGPGFLNTNGAHVAVREPQESEHDGYVFGPLASTGGIDRAWDVISFAQSSSGPSNRLAAVAWPARCGVAGTSQAAQLITNVRFPQQQVCRGQTATIEVDALHPDGPQYPVEVRIDGHPGTRREIQIRAVNPGTFSLTVLASTQDGLIESRRIEFSVSPCEGTPSAPIILATLSQANPSLVQFTLMNRDEFTFPSNVEWTFGDGSSGSTSYAFVEHEYIDKLGPTELSRNFDVSVTLQGPNGALTGTRTITIYNDYAITRRLGYVELPTHIGVEYLDLSTGTGDLTLPLQVTNPETNRGAELSRLEISTIPCVGAADPRTVSDSAQTLVVGANANQSTSIHVARGDLAGACAVRLVWVGRLAPSAAGDSETAAVAISHVRILSADTHWEPVSDPDVVSVLNQASESGLISDVGITSELELRRFAAEGRLPNMIDQNVRVLPTLGERCQPGEVGRPGLICKGSGAWEASRPMILDALAGDSVLAPGCNIISEVLSDVVPQQYYNHVLMMRENYTDFRHTTLQVDRLLDYREDGAATGGDGLQEHALRTGFPGTLSQSVAQAVNGQLVLDPMNNRPYLVDGLTASSVWCDAYDPETFDSTFVGDPDLVPPRVVRPDWTIDGVIVRERLRQAAIASDDVRGHYRFFAYSDALAARNIVSSTPAWTAGTNGLMCSSFIWSALSTQGFTFEGLQDTADLPLGGDVPDGTPDGLYRYQPEERGAAISHLRSAVEQLALNEKRWAWLARAPTNYSNQLVACFIDDKCAPLDELNCSGLGTTNTECAGTGQTVSPDQILLWDSPATGGPYGHSERMVFVPTWNRPVTTWQADEGTGTVRVHVVDVLGRNANEAVVSLDGIIIGTTDPEGMVTLEAVPGSPAGLSYRLEGIKYFSQSLARAVPVDVAVFSDQIVTYELVLVPVADGAKVFVDGDLILFDAEPWPKRDVTLTTHVHHQVALHDGQTDVPVGSNSGICAGDEIVAEYSITATADGSVATDPIHVDVTTFATEWINCRNHPDNEEFVDRTDRVSISLDGNPEPTLGELQITDENSVVGQNDFLKWNLRIWVEPSFDQAIADQFPGGLSESLYLTPRAILDYDESCPTPGSCATSDTITHRGFDTARLDFTLLQTYGSTVFRTCDFLNEVSLVAEYSVDGEYQLANASVRASGIVRYFSVKQNQNAAYTNDPCDINSGTLVFTDTFGPVEVSAAGTSIPIGPAVVTFPRFIDRVPVCPGGRCYVERRYANEAAVLSDAIMTSAGATP